MVSRIVSNNPRTIAQRSLLAARYVPFSYQIISTHTCRKVYVYIDKIKDVSHQRIFRSQEDRPKRNCGLMENVNNPLQRTSSILMTHIHLNILRGT